MKTQIHLILKILIILIPLIFLQYVFYQNFLVAHDFEYNYDIGSGNENYLSPVERISDKGTFGNIDYRNLTNNLVYFDALVQKGSENIDIRIKFYDGFPENSKFLLGAKDQKDWHYKYNVLYRSTIEELIKKYPYEQDGDLMLFKLNSNSEDYTIHDFLTNTPGVKLATDQEIVMPDFKIENYVPSDFKIKTSIRGSPTFYVYIKGDFVVEVEKLDLNWYENKDELEINLYYLNKTLIASETIKDDGEDDKNVDKNNDDTDHGKLSVSNLEEGVYKLELENNEDMLITNIKLNQNKIILYQTYFPTQNDAYFNNSEKTSKIYFKAEEPVILTAKTAHNSATGQTLRINKFELEIDRINKNYIIELPALEGFYELTSKKNDITITGPEFFSFSEYSWFNPFRWENTELREDVTYLEKNADYVLVEYKPVSDLGNGWKLAETSFGIEDVFIKDDKLSLLLNAPHLAENKDETNKMHISIDWIKSTVHKPISIALNGGTK